MKSVQIRRFSGSYFPVFGLNTGKYRPERTPYLDTFHAVQFSKTSSPPWNKGGGVLFMHGPKYTPLLLWWLLCDYKSANKNWKMRWCDFATLKMSHCFQRFVKNYYLVLDFFKPLQNVLIRNIRFLTLSFITTTLYDVLNKNKYQNNIS